MDWRPETVITFEIFQRMFDQLIPLINRIGTSSDFRSATFKFSQNLLLSLYRVLLGLPRNVCMVSHETLLKTAKM